MRKILLIMLVLIFTLMIMTSCLGQDFKNKNSIVVDSSSEPNGLLKKPVELKVSGFKSGSEIGAIPELNEKFMKENPDIKVSYEGMPGFQFLDYLRTRFVSGAASDVIMLHPGGDIAKYARAGYLMDLSDEVWVNDYTESAINAASVDGKVYGTPNDTVMIGVYYNKDIFKKLGLKVPMNWEEFLSMCEAIKASGITPISIGNNDGWMTLAALYTMAPAMIYSHYPDYDNKLNANKTKFTGTWDEMVKAWFSLNEKGFLTTRSTGISLDRAQANFARGESAMYIDGTWSLTGIRSKNPSINVGMFAMPSNGEGEKIWVTADVGTIWSINKATLNADAARRYLSFWAKEENQKIWTMSGGAFLTLKGKKSNIDPAFAEIEAILATGRSTRFPDQTWEYSINSEIMKAAQGVYLNALTTEQMLKNMDVAWEQARSK